MNLSIITVTWNSEEFITPLILSVQKACKNSTYEHIIVDNGSTDKTVEIIEQQFSHIQLIKNTTNLGFAAANNSAANIATGKFFLFLNPDMRLEEGSLDTMVGWLEQHAEIGIAGCKLVDSSGKCDPNLFPRRFPKFSDQASLMLRFTKIVSGPMNRYLMKDFDPEKEQSVDSVRGSFMFIRRELVDKNGWAFDPRYFIWFEDVDVCREAYKYGFKVVYTPIIKCYDYYGRSFNKNTDMLWKRKQFTKSMMQYFKKWEPWYVWVPLSMIRWMGLSLVALFKQI